MCDDFWSSADAQVSCRQLGFTSTGTAPVQYLIPSEHSMIILTIDYMKLGSTAITTGFTNGVGQIWLDNVQCAGTETRLIDCPANPIGNHNCGHIEDAGVTCQSGKNYMQPMHMDPMTTLMPISCQKSNVFMCLYQLMQHT